MLAESEALRVLREFGISGAIMGFALLQESEHKIVKVELEDSKKYVVKFPSGRNKDRLENQAVFSERLRNAGITTARRYNAHGHYCLEYVVDGAEMLVMVEEWLGEDFTQCNAEAFGMLGSILGKCHQIAITKNLHIGFSTVYSALMCGDAVYRKLWRSIEIPRRCAANLESIASLHDTMTQLLKELLPFLPKTAVHGDLGLDNNLILTPEGTIGIIDFHLAGDENLLFDMLATFYSSFYGDCCSTLDIREC